MGSGPGTHSLDLPKSPRWFPHALPGPSSLNTAVDGLETFMAQKTALIFALT